MSWDALRDQIPLRERGEQRRSAGASWVPPMDLIELPSHYVLVAELPGVTPNDFEVSAAGDTLTLMGHRLPVAPDCNAQFLRIERGQGHFSRSFSFPEPIDATTVVAEFKDGLLTITIAKAGVRGAHRIEIT